jgi:hypothetical protein
MWEKMKNQPKKIVIFSLDIAIIFSKNCATLVKITKHAEAVGIKVISSFFWSFELFVVGEGRRVCGLHQSLWTLEIAKQPSSSCQGSFSGERVQFYLPTGFESSIHRYVFKSHHVNAFFHRFMHVFLPLCLPTFCLCYWIHWVRVLDLWIPGSDIDLDLDPGS